MTEGRGIKAKTNKCVARRREEAFSAGEEEDKEEEEEVYGGGWREGGGSFIIQRRRGDMREGDASVCITPALPRRCITLLGGSFSSRL